MKPSSGLTPCLARVRREQKTGVKRRQIRRPFHSDYDLLRSFPHSDLDFRQAYPSRNQHDRPLRTVRASQHHTNMERATAPLTNGDHGTEFVIINVGEDNSPEPRL